jgi:hypothetical protein
MGQVGHLKMTHLFHPAGPNESPSRGATLDAYLHSANNSFPDWDAYKHMIGLGWCNKDAGYAIKIGSK